MSDANSGDIAIPYTFLGAAKLTLLGFAMTTLCGLIALRVFPDVAAGSAIEFVGRVGLAFFGACTLAAIWRMVATRGPVVTLTRTGLTDTRVASDEIPWSAIQNLAIWQFRGQKILVLSVDPAVEARLALTRMARWTRGANARLGADGLCVATQGLAMGCDDLARLCAAHVHDTGRAAP